MNKIEDLFKENVDIALDQLRKGIIKEFISEVIPFNFVLKYLTKKYQFKEKDFFFDEKGNYSLIIENDLKLKVYGNIIEQLKIKIIESKN